MIDLNPLVTKLKKHYKSNLVSVILFGSHARKQAKEGSDVDICVVLKKSSRSTMERISALLTMANQTYKRHFISFVVYTCDEAQKYHPLFLDMIDYSSILHDQDNFMKNRLNHLSRRIKQLGSKKVLMPDGSWYWDLKPDLIFGETFQI